jgi:hypothetical protein
MPIPANPFLIGLQVLIQGIDLQAPGGCPNPQFALTDSFSFNIR